MTSYVVDASVAVKWFVLEEGSDKARRLMLEADSLLAPDLMWIEVANALWRQVRAGRITGAFAESQVKGLLVAPVSSTSSRELLASALVLATSTGRTVYDCLYLALALDEGVQLVTDDLRFRNALADGPLSNSVCALGDYPDV